MVENVARFFALYDSDEKLRDRVLEAEQYYPGSLEIREAVVEAVLIPIAKELGYEFSVADLRAYETRAKLNHSLDRDGEYDRQEHVYWLLNRGWEEPQLERN